MIFALAGNQNCGKTTLFNQLTGSNQHVGNFPGVTVERKEGVIRGHKEAIVVDLPGIYSLSPYSKDEIVTRDYILNQHPDAIVNIVDAMNIERNLYLSMQLISLNVPMIIALNMMDEIRSNGGTIKVNEMAKELGVPIIPISASRNEGIGELIKTVLAVAKQRQKPAHQDFCAGPVHRTIHAVTHLIEDHAERIRIPPMFAAVKLIEKDPPLEEALELNEHELHTISECIEEMEKEMNTDRKAAIADMRYNFIDKLCTNTVIKPRESKQHLRSIRIDSVLTNKYLAIPAFIGIMGLIFWLTFSVIGSHASDLLAAGIDVLSSQFANWLVYADVNPIVRSMLIDGAFAGVGTVLSFVPTIVVMFFFLSVLEDSGYMARVAFVMDKLLRRIGLSGRSIVPMLIGFGCSVPAIMATRTLSSDRDRKMTILLTPFMSCSAKLPIYGMFTLAFFPKYRALVMILLYVFGIITGIFTGLIINKTAYKGNPIPFVMELPNYRFPSIKSTGLLLWEKTKDFLSRAFTVIFLATLAIWFLQSFDIRINPVADSSQSMLAAIGRLIAPAFVPLGFNDWKASTALLTGFAAKEAIISTLAVLTGADVAKLPSALSGIFTPLTAFVFLIFTLFYTPCVAAISVVKREMNSGVKAFGVVVMQTGIAWVIAFIMYRICLLFV
ncbi:MAG: ferrous iron transport protein B [Bacillota bacterium]|jgi:ferrous iron transport protein B